VLGDGQTVKLKEDGPFLTLPECEEAGEKAKSIFGQTSGTLDIDEHKYQVTNDMDMMKVLYLWMLNRKLKLAKHERECSACLEQQPGQEAHMNGCLEDWGAFVLQHLWKIERTVNPSDLAELYIELLKHVNVTVPRTVCAVAQCVKAYIVDASVLDEVLFYAEDSKWYSDAQDAIFSKCLTSLEEKQKNTA
jgi:hypothetical protein